MKVLFVVNARSGPRRRADVSQVIEEHCRAAAIDHDLVACSRKEDLDDIVARAIEEKHEVLYAVGGDGTVHEVAKRLIDTPLALGILPTGSGNGLARHLGVPLDLRRSLAACCAGRVETIDSAAVNGCPFVGVMGVGFDAMIAQRFGSSTTRGLRTYVRQGLNAFRSYAPVMYELEIDGRRLRQRAWIVAVANASQYGNDARIAPAASLQDGVLDVVIIGDVPLIGAPSLLIRLFNGTIQRSPHAVVLQARHVRIRREAEGEAHLDGEPVILPAALDVRVRPNSLRVLIPSTSARI